MARGSNAQGTVTGGSSWIRFGLVPGVFASSLATACGVAWFRNWVRATTLPVAFSLATTVPVVSPGLRRIDSPRDGHVEHAGSSITPGTISAIAGSALEY